MKVYFVYMIQSSINPTQFPGVSSDKIIRKDGYDITLYAFTDMKDRIEWFKKSRNMNLFKIVTKRMTKDEFLDLMCDTELVSHNLEPRSFSVEKLTQNNQFTSSFVDVLVTAKEFDYIFTHQDEIFSYIIGDYDYILLNKIPSNCFKKIYTDSLEFAVQYTTTMMPEDDIDDVPWVPHKYNQLALYCNQFKNTYNEESDIICECGNFLKNRKAGKKYPIR